MSSERFRCTTINIRKIAEIANLNSLFLVKRKTRQKAAPSEPVSTQYSQPITALIRDCTYRYSQYNISSTFGYTIPVLVTLYFF